MRGKPAFTAREGSCTVVAYRSLVRPDQFTLTYRKHAGAPRSREVRTGEKKARKRAHEIAIALANGRAEVLELTGADRETYRHVVTIAQRVGTPLLDLVEQAAAAKSLIGRHTLVEAAQFFDRGYIIRKTAPPSAEILRQLLDSFDRPRSYRYRESLERDLGKFVASFPDLTAMSEKHFRDWLRSLQLGARRRDNIRDCVVRLFRYARSKGFLPEDRKTEAEKVERIWEGSEVETFTPAELGVLLTHISPMWKPWMIIAAFAGLRTTEIFRLDWAAVKFDQRVIAVKRKVARKIRISRLVPMSDNLLAWLEPYRTRTGRLYANDNEKNLEQSNRRAIKKLARECGVKWRRNALRHSFGSHRVALVKSFEQVAVEMGNSPAKVRENYNDPKSEEEGNAYFSIVPPDRISNVVPMPLPLEFT